MQFRSGFIPQGILQVLSDDQIRDNDEDKPDNEDWIIVPIHAVAHRRDTQAAYANHERFFLFRIHIPPLWARRIP